MRKTFCDCCEKEIVGYTGQWDIRLTAGREHFPKTRDEVSAVFPPHAILDQDACSAECFLTLMGKAMAQVEALPKSIVIVPAPGDQCGNTRKLPSGEDCPGCRACK